jgi:hypothetical protein
VRKVVNVIKWTLHYFIRITITGFILIYLRWFQLTPVMGGNDPDGAYIVGLFLLGLYSFFAINLTKPSDDPAVIKMMLFILSTIFLLGNITQIIAFFPKLSSYARCAGRTYYITWLHPLADYQWTLYNLTIWKPFLSYEAHFFGYSGGPYKILCDEEKRETNIIRIVNDVLAYTDGENPRRYDYYTSSELGEHLYFLAEQCNDWVPSTCGSMTYTLYQCDLNYKSCDPLPIQLTTGDSGEIRVLEANKLTNEINLFDDFEDNPDRKLIFTYGEHPRCYVAGCEILEENK